MLCAPDWVGAIERVQALVEDIRTAGIHSVIMRGKESGVHDFITLCGEKAFPTTFLSALFERSSDDQRSLLKK